MKLSELEAREELFGRKIRDKQWAKQSSFVVFEFKLSNGSYCGVCDDGKAMTTKCNEYTDWEHVAEPKERYWLWIYLSYESGYWAEYGEWLTKKDAEKLLGDRSHSYRISPICPVEGVEL
jgi:hypothetical protein